MINIEKDKRWVIYEEDTNTIEDFEKTILPDLFFKKDVSEDVKKIFRVIYKLLVFSYYEYEFLDIAMAKVLVSFELALKIRYEEITGKKWDSKKKPLDQLINWFHKETYFEVYNPALLKQLRKARNHFSHPNRHEIAGIVGFHLIQNPVDLINDLYEDPILRKSRFQLREEMEITLNKILEYGAIVKAKDLEMLIWKMVVVFVNNKADKPIYYVVAFPIDQELEYSGAQPIKMEFDSFTVDENHININDGKELLCTITSNLMKAHDQANGIKISSNPIPPRHAIFCEKYFRQVLRDFQKI